MNTDLAPPSARYADHGDAASIPLVLLHGFPFDSSIFDRLVPLLTPRWRVVTIDLPGLGGSAVRLDEPSMPHLQESVIAVLDDLGLDSAYVLGIGAGGYVALEVAALSPDRLRGLVLSGSTCWVTDPDEPDQRRWLAAELDHAGSAEPLGDLAEAALGETARREQPDLLPAVRRVVAATDPVGAAWVARAVASRHDTSVTLRDLDRPVLLLFGAEDTEASPDRFAWAMNGMRGGGPHDTRLVILPGAGHLIALEQPEAVAGVLNEWLAELSG